MSIKIRGVLIGQYKTAFPDKKTGIPVPRTHFQVLIEKYTKDGSQSELVDLVISADKISKYVGMENKQVEVDVSYYGKCPFFAV